MTTAELVGILSTVIASAVSVAAWVTWRLSKHNAELLELRRDVDRQEGAHVELSRRLDTSLDRQGGRIGELEAEQRSQARICAERHPPRTRTVDVPAGGGL